MRHKGRTDSPPIVAMDRFFFEVDLHTLWEMPARARIIRLDGLALTIPPKDERSSLGGGEPAAEVEAQAPGAEDLAPAGSPAVLIDEIIAGGARLAMPPKDETKAPLIFDIHKLGLTTAGPGVAMNHGATLTKASPAR